MMMRSLLLLLATMGLLSSVAAAQDATKPLGTPDKSWMEQARVLDEGVTFTLRIPLSAALIDIKKEVLGDEPAAGSAARRLAQIQSVPGEDQAFTWTTGMSKYGVAVDVCQGKLVTDVRYMQTGMLEKIDFQAPSVGGISTRFDSPACIESTWYVNGTITPGELDQQRLCRSANIFHTKWRQSFFGVSDLRTDMTNGSFGVHRLPVTADWTTPFLEINYTASVYSVFQVDVNEYQDFVYGDQVELADVDYAYGGNYVEHRCLQQGDKALSVAFAMDSLVDSFQMPLCAFDDVTGKARGCRFHMWIALASAVADLQVNYLESACGVTMHFNPVVKDIDTRLFDLNSTSVLYDRGVGEGEYIVAFTATREGMDPDVTRNHRLVLSPGQKQCNIEVVARDCKGSECDDKIPETEEEDLHVAIIIAIAGGVLFVLVFGTLFWRARMSDKQAENAGHIRMLK